jgi:hypothetical protein
MQPRSITLEIADATLTLRQGRGRVEISHDQARALLLWLFRAYVTETCPRSVTVVPQSF